MQIIEKLRSFK